MSRSLQLSTVFGLVAIGLTMLGCGAAADQPTGEDPSIVSSEANKPPPPPPPAKVSYLALGDSIAFGFNPLVTTPSVPSSYVGYPEAIKTSKKVDLVNASCPGETSGSFLYTTAADNGCRNWKAAYSLHNDYETTQIAFVETFIKAHTDEKYISIDIGANDLLLLQNSCLGDAACIQAALPSVLSAYGTNLGTIYARVKAAGFKGKLVGVNVYAMNYLDPLSVGALTALNNVMSQVTVGAGGVVADTFTAFKTAAGAAGDSCAAGLLIKKPDGTCDIHPSPKGRDIIAATGVTAATFK